MGGPRQRVSAALAPGPIRWLRWERRRIGVWLAAALLSLCGGCTSPAPRVRAVQQPASPPSPRASAPAAAKEKCQPVFKDPPTLVGLPSTKLQAAGDPPLYRAEAGVEVYRFLWIRSFHPTIVVRIERGGDGARLAAWEFGENDDARHLSASFSMEVQTERRRALSQEEWEALVARIEETPLWQPSPPPKPLVICTPEGGYIIAGINVDGASWYLEGKRDIRYSLIEDFSPKSGPLREAGFALIRAAGFETEPDY
jgi:hypothetical protein